MSLIVKFVRNFMGYTISLIDVITRLPKQRRTPAEQEKVNFAATQLSLYQFFACPFCIKTRRAIHKLNLPIETRDATAGSVYREELEKGGGQIKVPCLRIEQDGKTQWMYESSEIIKYLEQRFA